jgi:hypothetical protein
MWVVLNADLLALTWPDTETNRAAASDQKLNIMKIVPTEPGHLETLKIWFPIENPPGNRAARTFAFYSAARHSRTISAGGKSLHTPCSMKNTAWPRLGNITTSWAGVVLPGLLWALSSVQRGLATIQ